MNKRYFLFVEEWSEINNDDERWSLIMPDFKYIYAAVKKDMSEEAFVKTMKSAINTFCKKILHPSYEPVTVDRA